jgi:hypothetical protein
MVSPETLSRPAPALTIVDAVHDEHLFARWFQPLESWAAWFVVLRALFGLTMTPSEIEIFQRFTGRSSPPTRPAREAWLIVGRRGGKSRIAALIAVFVAAFRDYRHILAPGEAPKYLAIRAHLPADYQDALDFAYETGWRKGAILRLPVAGRCSFPRTSRGISRLKRSRSPPLAGDPGPSHGTSAARLPFGLPRGRAPHGSALAEGLDHSVQGGGAGWQVAARYPTDHVPAPAEESPVMFKRYAVVRDADLPEAVDRLAAYRSTLPTERAVIPFTEVQEVRR